MTDRPRVDGDSLLLTAPPSPLRMVRRVNLEAEAIEAVAIELAEPPEGTLALFWARSGELFSCPRCIRLRAPLAGNSRTWTFNLSAHPQWTGTVRRLRLDLPGETARVRSITAVPGGQQRSIQPDPRHPWKIDLDHEVRNGLPAPPGYPITLQMDVPPRAWLKVAWGLQPGLRSPVRFTIRQQGAIGMLLDETLPPSGQEWREALIDLSALTGESVRLLLQTDCEGFRAGDGLPVWGDLQLLTSAASRERPNLIVISIDTLRADRLSLYDHERQTSPHIDAWARQRGVTFLNAIAAAPWTLPSHISMLTGLDALSHGGNYNLPAPPSLVTLAEILAREGYTTAALTGGGYLAPEYGLHQGFDRFEYWPGDRGQRHEVAELTDRALKWLTRERSRPFFLFFHTYEVHMPYREDSLVPEILGAGQELIMQGHVDAQAGFKGFRRFFLRHRLNGHLKPLPASEVATVSRLYDNGVTHVDHHIGRLLAVLEELHLTPATLVVLTSDHGELLGEHDLAGHAYLYDANLKVPLIIALPNGHGAGRMVTEQVRSVDIVPTVLDAVGLDFNSTRLDGASLLPILSSEHSARHRPAWSYAASTNHGISLRLANRLKYIYNDTVWAPASGQETLYRLAEDPTESQNATLEGPEVERLREHIWKRFKSSFGGLHLHLENAGTVGYRISVQGQGVLTPAKVKALGLPSPRLDLEWLGGGGMALTVPPATSFTLYLQGLGAGILELEVEGETGQIAQRNSIHLDLGRLAPLSRLVLTEEGWQEVSGKERAAPPQAAISIWAGSALAEAAGTSTSPRPELLEQLRALGYVN